MLFLHFVIRHVMEPGAHWQVKNSGTWCNKYTHYHSEKNYGKNVDDDLDFGQWIYLIKKDTCR